MKEGFSLINAVNIHIDLKLEILVLISLSSCAKVDGWMIYPE